jgi:hypothetical protein
MLRDGAQRISSVRGNYAAPPRRIAGHRVQFNNHWLLECTR